MRIAYCANVRLPSERAHGHQIAQACSALAASGHDVTIFAPRRVNTVAENFWDYYGADRRIRLEYLGHFDPIDHPLIPKVLQLPILNVLFRRNLRHRLETDAFDLHYTRAPALLPVLPPSASVLELHRVPRRGRRRLVRLCNHIRLVCCLTSPMRDVLLSLGVHPSRIIVEGDAVDLHRFENMPSKEEARSAIGLSTGRLVVGYAGRLKTLGMEKGVKHLLEAIQSLRPGSNFMALIVGGPAQDRAYYEAMARNLGLTEEDVRFTGDVPGSDIPLMLSACDVLAMPFPDLPHYRTNMSPLKMFEYMAAERPIITSDLPTVRDVLSEKTAFFCEPGDSGSLARMLRFIADHPDDAARRATDAAELATHHTWEERMKRILQASVSH